MATYEQYMDAARKADAAGNAADAKRLIELAIEAQGQPKTKQPVGTTKDGGKVFQMGDGSFSFSSPGFSTNNQDTIKRIMESGNFKRESISSFDKQTIAQAPITARAVKAMEGVPFLGSRVDEAAGAFGFGQGRATQGVRALSAAMDREKPGQSTALQLAGAIAGSIPMAMAAVPAIKAAAPVGRLKRVGLGLLGGAGAGATEGAIYGSGVGEGEERVENAIEQAKIGGALGGLLGTAAPLFADLTDAAVKALKNTDTSQIAKRFGISRQAAAVVKQHVDAGDTVAAQRALQLAGDDAMLGEATRGAQSLLDATSAMGGRSEQVVQDAIEARVGRGNAAFRAVSDDVLGAPPQGMRSAAEEISQRTGPQRKAAYDAFYNTPINYAGPEGRAIEGALARMPKRILKQAIDGANEQMIADGIPNMQIMAQIADDGKVSFKEMPNTRQLDALKRQLDKLTARDEFGRITAEGLLPQQLSGLIRQATIDATGGPGGTYAKALAVGGDKIAEDQALRIGGAILRPTTTRDDVIRAMQNASTDTRNSAKVGIRNAINEAMDNVKTVASDRNVDAREVNKAINDLSSKAMRDKIRIVLGKNEADRYFQEIDRLSSGLNLRAAVSENSRTARRARVQGTIGDVTAPNALDTLKSGEPLEATKRVVQLLTEETPEARAFRTEGVAEEIATFLTQTQGKTAKAALRYIQQAMDGQKLTDAQANMIANVLATSGFLAGGRATQQRLAPAP